MAKTGFGEHDLSAYALVADRITLFYQRYPLGRIVTELFSRTEREITFRALVFRGPADAEPAATGWASEREGDGDVNTVACLENAETSAIGRALANLGFSASRRRASRDEAAHAHRRPASPGMPLRMVREPASPGAAPLAGGAGDALQQSADALLDVLLVLAEAERAGFPATRAKALRRTLEARSVPPSALARARREVMTWFETHVPVPVISTEAPES